jgi:hypothetical protein
VQRRIRRAINPISTGLTTRWLGAGRRLVPPRAPTPRTAPHEQPRATAFFGVPSPGDWIVPDGMRPGWEWLPEYGACANLRAVPRWVRAWYRTPFIDRYAYEWMWWHGGWSVLVPSDNPPVPPDSGVREPRRPHPQAPSGANAARRTGLPTT